jgi:hypothetical protein
VLRVSAEELVGALAGERHRHVSRGELGECGEAERGEVRERLVELPNEGLEVDRALGHGQLELVVVGSHRGCDEPGVRELVLVAVFREADGEGFDGLAHVPRHQRDDEARVDAAAQHGAERDVAHEAAAHGVLELGEEPAGPLLQGAAAHGFRARIRPVGFDGDAALVHDEPVSGQELGHVRERGPGTGEESERQIGVDRLVVELRAHEARGEQALELRRKDDEIADARPVERLDAEPVARDDASPPAAVPDGERELPSELLGDPGAVALVEVGEDLRVAPGPEDVPLRGELAPDLDVVVKLAVLDRPDLAGLVGEGLVAPVDVDDAEAPDAERDAVALVRPAVVRAAVRHRVGHAVERLGRYELPRLAADLDDSADAAHLRSGR